MTCKSSIILPGPRACGVDTFQTSRQPESDKGTGGCSSEHDGAGLLRRQACAVPLAAALVPDDGAALKPGAGVARLQPGGVAFAAEVVLAGVKNDRLAKDLRRGISSNF